MDNSRSKHQGNSLPSLLSVAVLSSGITVWMCLSVSSSSLLSAQIRELQNNEQDSHLSLKMETSSTVSQNSKPFLDDETNVPIPRNTDGSPMSLAERLRYLELKVMANMNFGTRDPWFGTTEQKGACKNKSRLESFGCKENWEGVNPTADGLKCIGLFDQLVCLDDLPEPREWDMEKNQPVVSEKAAAVASKSDKAPCLVYDFGIRGQPQFGAVMARSFGCEVHAFDPSPVSNRYMSEPRSQKLRDMPNYEFHPYGAGGVDGVVRLFDYDWGQVSNIRFPKFVRDCSEAKEDDSVCKGKPVSNVQKTYDLPVKTLSTVRKELGHEGRTIDVLKIDVEGSEFAFLEQMLDTSGGCPDYVNQITLEWHHFAFDSRYGEGASPPINTISTLLKACGFELFDIYSRGGWPSLGHMYEKMQMRDVRYNVAAFRRVPSTSDNKSATS